MGVVSQFVCLFVFLGTLRVCLVSISHIQPTERQPINTQGSMCVG